MTGTYLLRSGPTNLSRVTPYFLLLILLVAFLPSPPAVRTAAQAQPSLLSLAAEHPEMPVRVIVQELAQESGAEQLALSLGAVVTTHLRIINAFVAQLPAEAAMELARSGKVRWVSLDAPTTDSECEDCIDTSRLASAYIKTIGADKLWNEAPYLQGQGITVAVVDSGINHSEDFEDERVLANEKFNSLTNNSAVDQYGHGTHVAGIIGGSGENSSGAYTGVAPKVNLINLKVSDGQGAALTSGVVSALERIYHNKTKYNIRVVNLSLNSSVDESYHTNPLAAAAEFLWFNGIVVVVSGGNGERALYPPANDPFVISVGATRDQGTPDPADDVVAPYSGVGTTSDGFAKPELFAPGSNIVSVFGGKGTTLGREHPDHIVGKDYFRMSGTSMSAPMVTAAVALLLQDEPGLTPDQVKYRLLSSARPLSAGGTAAAYLDVYAAVHGTTTESANTGTAISQLLLTGDDSVTWDSKSWDSKSWNSKSWNSKSWNSKSWNSKSWNSDTWTNDYWGE